MRRAPTRAGGDLGVEIAHERVGHADVLAQHLEQRFVEARRASRSFSGGMRMPSWKISVALVGIEPGVMPPTSWWWVMVAGERDRGRRWKTGMMTARSGRCVPPQ